MYALFKIFKYCFRNHCLPSVWLKAVIHPIQKGAEKDLYLPLSYHGISPLATTCKIYTGILNARVINYLNSRKLICDEQYGFREGKSRNQYVYNISSIIRQRISQNKCTCPAFIDVAKAFERVDSSLLLYRLLKHYISGNIYSAIKSLHADAYNSIRIGLFLPVECGRVIPYLPHCLISVSMIWQLSLKNSLHLGINFGDSHLCILE